MPARRHPNNTDFVYEIAAQAFHFLFAKNSDFKLRDYILNCLMYCSISIGLINEKVGNFIAKAPKTFKKSFKNKCKVPQRRRCG